MTRNEPAHEQTDQPRATLGTVPTRRRTKRPPRIVPADWFIHEACVIGTGDLKPREPDQE